MGLPMYKPYSEAEIRILYPATTWELRCGPSSKRKGIFSLYK